MLKLGAADDGLTNDGHRFRRLALYAEESYVLVSVDPANGEAWFKLYGKSEYADRIAQVARELSVRCGLWCWDYPASGWSAA